MNAAQAGSTLDAPVDGRSDHAIPAIHIATGQSTDRAPGPPRMKPPSSCATCPATTGRFEP
jgi:hypothetical protein